MKKIKKILSIIMAAALALTALPMSFVGASAASPIDADASLVINRPAASVFVTEVTRVAYQTNSMKAPSGNNSVIVKSTPSGIPYLSATSSKYGYANETPSATTIVFTPGVVLDEDPVLTCTNPTVKWDNFVFANGTYTWTVTGGTAFAGSTLIFNVNYKYTDYNAVTDKTYTRTYVTSGTSYVEPIATPAGLFTTKRTYADWGLGTTTQNRSYLASYILGKNTYGSIYNNGEPDGSVHFASPTWINGGSWTDEYGMMQSMSGSDATRNYNVAFGVDTNRPLTTVYFDRSIMSTLSDLNLRAVSAVMDQSDESDERVTVTMNGIYVLDGMVKTADASKDDLDLSSDVIQEQELGIIKPSNGLYATGSNFTSAFTGTGPAKGKDNASYTVVFQYQTAAGWDGVYVSHTYSLNIISYDKGNLRTLVESIQNTDPSVKITDVPENDFKGYNPQDWYFGTGWEQLSSALNSAKSCLDRPDVSQSDIDSAYNNLLYAYKSVKLQKADYSKTETYYNQAMAKNPENYTLASWAKLQTLLDNYRTDYSVIYQPAVDKMGMDIKSAMDNLEEIYADYTELYKQLATVNTCIRTAQSTYKKSPDKVYLNWNNLASVLENAGCTYNELDGYTVENMLPISEQAKLNGYVSVVKSAVENLTLAGADYSNASKAESAYKKINVNCVVDNVANKLKAAYNTLFSLHNLDISHQSEIDAATAELNEWLGKVQYKPADISAAEEKILEALSIDSSKYDDFSGVEQAIANLESKLELDIRYQSEINSAVAALQSAIDRLVANSADYTEVDNAIEAVAAAERLILETYEDSYGFTAPVFYSNWSSVTQAVNSVVRGLDAEHQSQVDNYAVLINTALENLTENTADYSRVNALKEQAYDLYLNGASLYTSASRSVLLSVYSAVENSLPISRQADVDGYAAALQQAIDNLEYLPADYSGVTVWLNNAAAKIKADEDFSEAHPGYSLYTAESLTALEIAMAEVVDDLDVRYQSTVTGYANDISAAVGNLKYAPADYTAVNQTLDTVPKDLSLYTDLSKMTLNTVINGIRYDYTAEKQSTVDKYVTSINSAVAKLKFKSADYTAVNEAKNLVPKTSLLYTTDSWQALQDQLNAVVYNLDITHQSEVDRYAENIRNAVSLLAYKSADYTAVDEAKNLIPKDLSLYTEESVNNLQNVLDSVNYYCDITQQSVVDGYASSINSAREALKYRPANYDALNSAVSEANEKIKTNWYTDESVAVLNGKIEQVEYNLDISRQQDIYSWTEDIVKATKDLVLKLADYTELQNLLNLLDNSGSEIYTITYTNFNEVIELINKYRTESVKLDLTADKQDDVDNMVKTLKGYIDSLVPAETEKFEFIGTAKVTTKNGVKYVYGFTERLSKNKLKNNYTHIEGNLTCDITTPGGSYVGTGSIITVSNSKGEQIDRYIVVLYGDVDGNAKIDSDDRNMIVNSLSGAGEPLTGANKFAANVSGSTSTINSQDYDLIADYVAGGGEIDQGKALK